MSHVGSPCRYQTSQYRFLREKKNLSRDRTYERYRRWHTFLMSKGLTYRNIIDWGLDNPFMSTDARRVMLNQCWRVKGFYAVPKR